MTKYFFVFWSVCLLHLFSLQRKHAFFFTEINEVHLILHIFTLSGLLISLTLGSKKMDSVSNIDHKYLSS